MVLGKEIFHTGSSLGEIQKGSTLTQQTGRFVSNLWYPFFMDIHWGLLFYCNLRQNKIFLLARHCLFLSYNVLFIILHYTKFCIIPFSVLFLMMYYDYKYLFLYCSQFWLPMSDSLARWRAAPANTRPDTHWSGPMQGWSWKMLQGVRFFSLIFVYSNFIQN